MSQTENAPAASTEAPAALSLLDEIVEATRFSRNSSRNLPARPRCPPRWWTVCLPIWTSA